MYDTARNLLCGLHSAQVEHIIYCSVCAIDGIDVPQRRAHCTGMALKSVVL